MKRYFVITIAALAGIACGVQDTTSPTVPSNRGGKADNPVFSFIEGEYIPYVFGYEASVGQVWGGGHQLLIPSTEDGREPIDSANSPSRLHPDLVGDAAMKYDVEVVEGTADHPVFASQWWPQSKNGLAWRWNSNNSNLGDLTSDPDGLSPSEKYDVLFYPGQQKEVPEVKNWSWRDMKKPEDERPEPYVNPAVTVAGPTTEWELLNHGKYQHTYPDSWWGHCNGWASYATAEKLGFPKRDVRVKLVDGKITECLGSNTEGCTLFRMGDIEALMTEIYFSDSATFSGRRCNEEPDEMERDEFGRPKNSACRDINAGTFHVAITQMLGKGQRSLAPGSGSEKVKLAFVIDHNYDYQVWNFPLRKFKVHTENGSDGKPVTREISAAEAAQMVGAESPEYQFNPNATRFIKVKTDYWMVSDGVPAYKMAMRADERGVSDKKVTLDYVLELDNKGTILGGEWIKDPSISWGEGSKKLHPDFLWMAVKAQGYYEDEDDLGGSRGDNPFIAYSKVKALLLCANKPETCKPEGEEPGEGPQTLLSKQNESVAKDETKSYTVTIPAGGSKIVVELLPSSGDPDLKITYGGSECYPYTVGDEKCEFASPAAGEMEILVIGYSAANYALTAVLEMDGGGNPTEPNICKDSCGAKASGFSCYCDKVCKDYGDCCQNAQGGKGGDHAYVLDVCTF